MGGQVECDVARVFEEVGVAVVVVEVPGNGFDADGHVVVCRHGTFRIALGQQVMQDTGRLDGLDFFGVVLADFVFDRLSQAFVGVVEAFARFVRWGVGTEADSATQ